MNTILSKYQINFQVNYRIVIKLFLKKVKKREDMSFFNGYMSVRSSIIFSEYCKFYNINYPPESWSEKERAIFFRVNIGRFNNCIDNIERRRVARGLKRNFLVMKNKYPIIQFVGISQPSM